MQDDFKLCYVEGNSAFFTTKDLADQWGDDWNDAPYECNAGEPYEPHPNRPTDWHEDRSPKWKIKVVTFEGEFASPCDGYLNSPYSVEMINAGQVPWLVGKLQVPFFTGTLLETFPKDGQVRIFAGTPLEKFLEITKNG